jgi:gliding motility-associated-like protein
MNKLLYKSKVKYTEMKGNMQDDIIHHKEKELQQIIGNENPFTVPDNYFEHMTEQVLAKTKQVRFIHPWQKILEIASYAVISGGILMGGYFLLHSFLQKSTLPVVQSAPANKNLPEANQFPEITLNDAKDNPVVLVLPTQENIAKPHVIINPQAPKSKITQSIHQLPLPDDQITYLLQEISEKLKDNNPEPTTNKSNTVAQSNDLNTPSQEEKQNNIEEYLVFEQPLVDTCVEAPIRLNASIPGGTEYKWSSGETTSSILVQESGTYRVTVTLSNGNAQIKNIRVKIIPRPQLPKSSIIKGCAGEPVTLSIQQNSNVYTYEWPQLKSKDPVVEVSSPGWYYGYITGCKTYVDSFYVKLNHCDVYIPSAFSPNGDGINDYFYIGNIDKYPGTELKVYNRHNTLVFHSTNYQNEWNGENCEEGTYLYILRFPDGIVQEGTVTIRK